MTEATESDYRQEQGDLFSLLGGVESEVTVGKATSSPKSPGSVSPDIIVMHQKLLLTSIGKNFYHYSSWRYPITTLIKMH